MVFLVSIRSKNRNMEIKRTNKEKVLDYLLEVRKKVSREELVEKTGVSSSNFSKLLKKLEDDGKIIKKYEQVGPSKFLYISLKTNSATNSISQNTISIKEPKTIKEKKLNPQIQNTISNKKTTNSIQKETISNQDIKQKYQKQLTKDQKLANFIRTISGPLVIAMNYAINSIKNKPEVVEEKQDATRYNYFKNWTQYREVFRNLEEEAKKEMNISKEGV